MDNLSKRIFNDFTDNKYYLKFRDMYFLLYDYLVDNKINIYVCINEYIDPYFKNFIENYDEKEPYISTLVVSLFCSLQATSSTEFQKELPVLYLKNLIKILDSKYHHKSYCTLYDRIKNNFREKLDDIKIKNKIALSANMIIHKESNFETIQKIIHNFRNIQYFHRKEWIENESYCELC